MTSIKYSNIISQIYFLAWQKFCFFETHKPWIFHFCSLYLLVLYKNMLHLVNSSIVCHPNPNSVKKELNLNFIDYFRHFVIYYVLNHIVLLNDLWNVHLFIDFKMFVQVGKLEWSLGCTELNTQNKVEISDFITLNIGSCIEISPLDIWCRAMLISSFERVFCVKLTISFRNQCTAILSIKDTLQI